MGLATQAELDLFSGRIVASIALATSTITGQDLTGYIMAAQMAVALIAAGAMSGGETRSLWASMQRQLESALGKAKGGKAELSYGGGSYTLESLKPMTFGSRPPLAGASPLTPALPGFVSAAPWPATWITYLLVAAAAGLAWYLWR